MRMKAGLLFLVLAFILYGNTIPNKYALDDEYVTYNNHVVMKGIKAIPEIFTSFYTDGANSKFSYGYRPVAKATFAIENQFFGQNPHISHFINVLLYALTGFLLFLLLKKLLRNYHIVFPLLITLLFMAHPVHTEVVASLKNRDELLSFIGCLLTVHFSVKYWEEKHVKFIAYGIFWIVFAYFSKPSALTFLAVVPLVAYFFTNASWKKIAIYTGFLLAGLALFLVLAKKMYLPAADRTYGYFENPLFFEKSFWIRSATGFYSLAIYLKLLVFPHPLVYYYGYDHVPIVNWTSIVSIVTFLFFSVIGIWTLMKLKQRHILAFAIAYFIITISMFTNIVVPAVGIVAERFVYAASLGFCIALAYFLLKFTGIPFTRPEARIKQWSTSFIGLTAVLMLLWTGRTIARNPAWKDHLTLYSNDIKYLHNSAKAHDMLGGKISSLAATEPDPQKRNSMVQQSISYYQQALKIYPDFISAHNNLGSVYANFIGDHKAAIPYFRRAIELDSSYAQAMFNLAFCLARTGEKDEAVLLYERALKADPDKYPIAYANLGQLYFEKGQFEKAVELNKAAIPLYPGSDMPYVNIGNLYLQKTDTINAVAWWEKGLEVYPYNKDLASNLGKYYAQKGNKEKSGYYLRMANTPNSNALKE